MLVVTVCVVVLDEAEESRVGAELDDRLTDSAFEEERKCFEAMKQQRSVQLQQIAVVEDNNNRTQKNIQIQVTPHMQPNTALQQTALLLHYM